MIVAGHAVNDALPPLESALPTVEGLDLAATVDRVAGWGGDPALYVHFVSRGLAASDRQDALAARRVGVIAGWRSGALGLRAEALRLAGDGDQAVAAAALGLDESTLSPFVAAQGSNRFAHPQLEGVIARVGGFRGFGGPWIAPPTDLQFVGDGQLDVICGAELWRIAADVFCSRLERVPEISPSVQAAQVRAEVSPSSYLVTISRDAA